MSFSAEMAPRIARLNDRPITGKRPDGGAPEYVLCWVQQALRAHDNPAIDAAVELANGLGLPVVVYHGLRMDYPYASDRLHRFILGASRDLQRLCEARGLRCITYLETTDVREKGLVYRLASRAAAVVTDDQFVFVARWQADAFARGHEGPVIAVDAARLVPTRMLPTGLAATRDFRRASGEHRDTFLAHATDYEPEVERFDGGFDFEDARNGDASDADLDARVAACAIDHSLPVAAIDPSRDAATDGLATFVADELPGYADRRNNPADESGVSRLSPYLHFGVLGPREIARAVWDADVKSNPRWKFLDEMLTWREHFHYISHHSNVPASFESLPKRARESLLAHADDPRDRTYTLDQLLHGETDDETWNAAQRQWLATGYMHNNLRMYWGKQLIGWTDHPVDAWITALYINDRLSLDGRDPSTYGNMQWCFGRSKPAYREQPVYGWVPPKRDTAVRKRKGAEAWLAKWASADVPRVSVPNAAFVATGFETAFRVGER